MAGCSLTLTSGNPTLLCVSVPRLDVKTVCGYMTVQDHSARDQPLETSTLFNEDKESHLSPGDLRLHKEGLVTGTSA